MNLKKIIILLITAPLLILVLFFLYNMYSNNRSHKIISNFCFDTKISDTTENVFILAEKQGLKYSQKGNLIEINKNMCTCNLKIKDKIVVEKVSVVCVY